MVPNRPPTAVKVAIAEFRRWLELRGVNMTGIEVTSESSRDPEGFAVVLNDQGRSMIRRKWLRGLLNPASLLFGHKEVTMATFKLDTSLINVKYLLQVPGQGPIFSRLLHEGMANEHEAVILHLAVELARGEDSELYPWVQLLPSTLNMPLFWSEQELDMIRGTALHRATVLRKNSLHSAWTRLEPVSQQLVLASEGTATSRQRIIQNKDEDNNLKVSLEDFFWAAAVYWSRAIQIPNQPNEQYGQGIVPGLDFCNHDRNSLCRWKISQVKKGSTSVRGSTLEVGPQAIPVPRTAEGDPAAASLQLVCPKNSKVSKQDEITINYGNKSNEQLLFLYGFVLEDNPDDNLMVACPLPPHEEWDKLMQARIALLQQRGLKPQLFLPMKHLEEYLRCESLRNRRKQKAKSGPVEKSELPEGVVETLEVFIMEPRDILKELESATSSLSGKEGDANTQNNTHLTARKNENHNLHHGNSLIESSGNRMAWLTTLSRLLELKCEELEGSDGTGSLEEDEKLLYEGGASLNSRQRMAVIYRASQKRLARQYLKFANSLLQREMSYLKSLSS